MRCLKTIYSSQTANFEIIVRDNGSQDGTRRAIRKEYPGVIQISDACNVGFSAANNEGIRAANGQYLLLLNPDTELPPTALANLVRVAQTHHDQAMIVPILLNSDGTGQPSLNAFPTITGVTRGAIKQLRAFGQRQPIGDHKRDVDWAKGACLFIPRVIYEKVGPLDENIFMYGEDLDYCWRIHQAGFNVLAASDIKIIHHGNVSGRQKWGDQRVVKTNQAIVYFWVKHFGLIYSIGLMLFRVGHLLVRSGWDLVQGFHSRSETDRFEAGLNRLMSILTLVKVYFDVNAWSYYLSGWRGNR